MQYPKMKIFGDGKKIFKSAFSWFLILFFLAVFPASQSWGGKATPAAPPGKAGPPPLLMPPPPAAPSGKPAPAGVSPSYTLAVIPKTTIIDAGRIQTSDFSALFVFTIKGDLGKVAIFLEASDLYIGGDPADPRRVGAIALNTGRPAEIMAEFATSSRNTAFWRGAGNPISGYPTKKTETLIYGGGRGSHFSQDVSCRIWYTQPVGVKPAGQYGGLVRLNTMFVP